MSPALAGGFFTTEPPGKPLGSSFKITSEALLEIRCIQYMCYTHRDTSNLFSSIGLFAAGLNHD